MAEITERLAELHAQKDAAVEAVFARLAPLEARLAELRPATRRRRSTASPSGSRPAAPAGADRGGENPVAEISGQLAGLHAQKDATVETVFAAAGAARGPARAELDPQGGARPLRERLEGRSRPGWR